MKIMIGNDDGICAGGIKALVNELKADHEILVVAPDSNRSGFSHSLTVRRPLRVEKSDVFDDENVKAYSVTGTPADCIKLGFEIFNDFQPDVVIGGINHGANLGIDTMYSGTCGVAMEGLNLGICGIAVSLNEEEGHFETAAKVVKKFIQPLYNNFDKNTMWNINVPNVKYDDLKGVMFTQIGLQIYAEAYAKHKDDQGDFYRLEGYALNHEDNHENGDVEVVKKGFVSITPILVNRTNFDALEKAKDISLKL